MSLGQLGTLNKTAIGQSQDQGPLDDFVDHALAGTDFAGSRKSQLAGASRNGTLVLAERFIDTG